MTRRYAVAIAGGGQLARMMHQAAIGLGIDVHLLAEGPDVSAAQVVRGAVVGDYRSLDTLMSFTDGVDVLTFDHEHVPQEVLRALILAASVGAILILIASRYFTEPMRQMAAAAEKFSRGDFSQRVEAHSRDEIGLRRP